MVLVLVLVLVPGALETSLLVCAKLPGAHVSILLYDTDACSIGGLHSLARPSVSC